MQHKTRLSLFLIGFVLTQAPETSAQDVSWIRQFGTVGFDTTDGIAADADYVYVTGRVGSNRALPGQVSAGGVDTFVRKYDAEGIELWTRQFGTSSFDGVSKIAVHPGSLYVAGFTTGTFPGQLSAGGLDIFIRQYDTDGHEGWTQEFGTSGNEFVLGIAGRETGVYLFGITSGVFPGQTSAGGQDFFLAKLDVGGSLLWVRQFGTSSDDPAIFSSGGIAVDDTGVYVGSTVPVALPGQLSVGDADAFLRKYDFDGNGLWTTQFGTACADLLSGVAVNSTGLYVTGSTLGHLTDPFFPRCAKPPAPNHNFGDVATTFVQRRTGNGAVLWSRQYEGSSGPTGFSLGIDLTADATSVYVASEAIRPRDPGALDPACPVGRPAEDIHVRAYNFEGEELWTRLIGSTASDVPSGISVNGTGVYVGGSTSCQLTGQTSAGSYDALAIKLTLGR